MVGTCDGETRFDHYKGSLPRAVIFTCTSPVRPLALDTSQRYTPLSAWVTLLNLRELSYIVTRLAYGAVEEWQHYKTDTHLGIGCHIMLCDTVRDTRTKENLFVEIRNLCLIFFFFYHSKICKYMHG